MNGSPRLPLVLATLLLVLTAGCGRRSTPASADATPEVPAAPDSTTATMPNPSEPGLRDIAAAPEREISTPAPASPSASLLAADASYEAWFKKHKLDLNDPAMLEADPDKDGVKNRDEFMADTDPMDPKSMPSRTGAGSPTADVHPTMRLREFNEIRLPMVLEQVDGQTAKIKRTDGGGARSETVRAGETLSGSAWRVARVQGRRGEDKHGDQVDSSRVILEDTATREEAILVKDLPARSSTSSAVLASDDGKSTVRVKQGDTFEWPSEPGRKFKVLDLRTDQAILQQVDSGQTWTVPKQ